jgi:hypothetical protein
MISLVFTILIAVCAAVQAFLQLKGDADATSKIKLRKTLAVFVIVGLFMTIISFVIQYFSDESFQEKINTIASNSSQQLKYAIDNQEKTNAANRKLDSVFSNLDTMVAAYEEVVEQYKIVKKGLSDQVDLEKTKLAERAPVFQMRTYDLKWQLTGTNSYEILACAKNYGNRSAILYSATCIALFIDSLDRVIDHTERVRDFGSGYNLEPYEPNRSLKCFGSTSPPSYNPYHASFFSAYVMVKLNIKYADILSTKPTEKSFWITWSSAKQKFVNIGGEVVKYYDDWIKKHLKESEFPKG